MSKNPIDLPPTPPASKIDDSDGAGKYDDADEGTIQPGSATSTTLQAVATAPDEMANDCDVSPLDYWSNETLTVEQRIEAAKTKLGLVTEELDRSRNDPSKGSMWGIGGFIDESTQALLDTKFDLTERLRILRREEPVAPPNILDQVTSRVSDYAFETLTGGAKSWLKDFASTNVGTALGIAVASWVAASIFGNLGQGMKGFADTAEVCSRYWDRASRSESSAVQRTIRSFASNG